MRSTPLAGDRTCSQTAGGGEEEGRGGGEGGHTDRDRQTDTLKQEKTSVFFRHIVWGHSRRQDSKRRDRGGGADGGRGGGGGGLRVKVGGWMKHEDDVCLFVVLFAMWCLMR